MTPVFGKDISRARWLAFLIPAALMAGALGSQYIGGLFPCEMCQWQRWPHYAAIGLALAAFGLRTHPLSRWLVLLAAVAILTSGAIGVYHAGVEYKWWEGLTTCSRPPGSGGSGDLLADIMHAPMIRCDEVQWSLGGISLAGFNALLSIAGAFGIFNLLRRSPR
jgi:disulfide bond formation protein DsbB